MASAITVARESVLTPPAVDYTPVIKRALRTAAIVAVAFGVALATRYWWSTARFLEATDDAYVGGDITAIAPHVAGFVGQVLVVDNERVRAGQALVRIDDRDAGAALAQAAAAVQESEAAVATLEARLSLQQSTIRRARAELAEREAGAAFARQDAARYARLARSQAASMQAAELSRSADDKAQAAVAAAEARVAAERQQSAVLTAEVAEARSRVARAEARRHTAEIDLDYTLLRAPIDGYVGNRAVRPGVYVTAGTYMMSIVPTRGLWVDANFKEDQLAHMRPGQPVTVVADAYPDLAFPGHVASLAPATGATFSIIPPENASGNFTKIVQRVPVRIALDAADAAHGRLRPGLSTVVTVDVREAGLAADK